METLTSRLNTSGLLAKDTEFLVNRYSENLLDNSQTLIKRISDIFLVSLFLFFIGSWLFAIIAICIKLESKGPVIFRQLRHGQDNVPFFCLKFRSMYYNPTGQFKLVSKNDSRITRVGRILRKTSLDELPQLINVLIGEMSLVGPRPHAIVMNSDYSQKIEHFMCRHCVKPGITGLAQSKGFRGEIRNNYDINCRLKYDLFYIKNWNLYFDFKIIYLTVICMISNNDNAY